MTSFIYSLTFVAIKFVDLINRLRILRFNNPEDKRKDLDLNCFFVWLSLLCISTICVANYNRTCHDYLYI